MGLLKIAIYSTPSGKAPFSEWQNTLDIPTRALIKTRISRVKLGNFGDCKSVGDGIRELRINYGPGYRIYFGMQGSTLVILLTGGDKRSQLRDIAKAKKYWLEYKG